MDNKQTDQNRSTLDGTPLTPVGVGPITSVTSTPPSVSATPAPTYVARKTSAGFAKLQRGHVRLIAAVLISLLIVVGGLSIFLTREQRQTNSNTLQPVSNYDVQEIPLDELTDTNSFELNTTQSLSINGQLRTNGSLVLTPTTRPDKVVTGQIYFDTATNTPYIYNGTNFVAMSVSQAVQSIGGQVGNIALGPGLALQNGQLSVDGGVLSVLDSVSNGSVTSVQGQTGAVAFSSGEGITINGTTITNTGVVSIQAASPQLAVTQGANGAYTIGTVGNLATATGSVGQVAIFDSANNLVDSLISQVGSMVAVSGDLQVSGQVQANTIASLTPGTELTISAGNDQLVFVSGGRTFQLPAAGGVNQTICTVGMDCTSGGGSVYVQLQPGMIQNDSGAGASIHINNTGGGDLLHLQGNSVDAFVIDNAGNTTIAGNLAVVGAINGATVNNANISGGTITGANINNASITGGSLTNTTVNGLTVTSTAIASDGALTISATNNQNLNLNTSGTGIITLGTAALQGSGALTISAGGTDQNLTLTGAGTGNVVVQTPIFHNANGATYAFDPADLGTVNAVICTSVGNCSGGGLAGNGTAGTIAVWTGTGFSLGDSLLSQSGSSVTVTGDLTADSLQGNGSGLTSVDAVSLSGQAGTFYQDASNLNTGTINDLRLSANVAKYADATANFTGALKQNGADVCTTAGNCAGTGAGIGGNGTAGTIAVWTGTGFSLTDSVLTQTGGNVNASGDLSAGGSLSATGTLSGASLAVTGAIGGASLNVSGAASAGSLSLTGALSGTTGVFTGAVSGANAVNGNEFVTKSQLDSAIGGVGGGVTSLNALAGGLVIQGTPGQVAISDNGSDTLTIALDSSVTLQGNIVNAANGLVKLDGSGYLPALNGSALTDLSASNIVAGTLADGRLSANVALLNQNNNFTGATLQHNGYTVCTMAGNCVGSPGGAVDSSGTSGRVALYGSDGYHLADSYLLQGSGVLTLDSGTDFVLAGGNLSVTGTGSFTGTVSGADAVSGTDFVTKNQLTTAIGGVGGGVSSLNSLSGDLVLQGTAGQISVTPVGDTFTFALDTSVTVQGNTFNGAGQLVQLNGSTQLPGVDGSLLTSVNAATLQGQNGAYYLDLGNATGTLAVARIADGSLTNAKLANSSLTVSAGTGLTGGGLISLGGTTTLNLAATAVTLGSYGSASSVATFTVDQQGRLTAAASVPIAIDANQITSGTIASARISGNYNGITGTGILGAGSITSGFGAIDTGADNITTTGTIAGGTVNATSGGVQTNGTLRLDSAGALSNITGYSQTSGNFTQSGTGTFATGTGAVSLNGATTANSTLTVAGATTLQNTLTITGAQFTNQGSTLNTALTLGNFAAGGSIGTALATVDTHTSIAIAQTTAGQTLTLPSPTTTTAGRVVYIFNTGSTGFTMGGITVPNGYGQIFLWNGSAWILGANGGGSAITLQGAYDGGNTLNTTDARDIAFTLSNTTTDANYKINIATGSTGQFKIQNNGTDLLSMGASGQLNLATQGATGGLAIGGDTLAYRSGANRLQMNNALTLRNTTDSATALQIQNATGQDVLTIDTANKTLSVGAPITYNLYSYNPATGFSAPVNYTTGSGPISGIAADFNADGKVDLAVANRSSNSVSIFIGNGNGTFLTKVDYTTAANPNDVTAADFNADGKVDLAVVNNGSNFVSIFIGNGDGTFLTKVDYTTGSAPIAVTAADFNTDGKVDLAVANRTSSTVSVFIGNGNGTFQTKVDYAAGVTPNDITSADFNADGKVDVAVANQSSHSVSVIIGNGDGTFQTAVTYATNTTGTSNIVAITSADFNGDSKPDLAAVNSTTTTATVSISIGNGDGTFQTAVTYATGGSGPGSVAGADLNGDNKIDLVIPNTSSNNVSILINGSSLATTVVSSGVSVNAPSATGTAMTLQAASGQGVDIFRVQAADATGLFTVAKNGNVGIGSIGNLAGLSTALTVSGSVGATTYYQQGNQVCDMTNNCGYLKSSNDPQNANFNITGQGQIGGALTVRTATDTTAALKVQDAAGNTLLNADTANQRLSVGSATGTNARLYIESATGNTWTARTAAEANNWQSVTYGNGLFVAVAQSGTNRVMTSPDGITWTARTAAEANVWKSVTYGNGLFVAVAQSGTNRVMTSPDGITWTARTATEANAWKSVTYGGGLFVAVSEDGTNRVMTSPDGITWTARTAAEANAWSSVTYGNGQFVAVASTGTNRVMTSPDGITWTARTAAASNAWNSVTYGNDLFVAVSAGGGTNRVMTSPDGITWTARTAAEANAWISVTYGNGRFVAVASTGTNRVMTSLSELAMQTKGNTQVGGILTIDELGTANTSTLLCRNSSNQIADCSTTGNGAPFIQGGNSLGTAAILGTNDNQDLILKTNNVTRLTVASSGAATFSGTLTVTGAATFNGGIFVNGHIVSGGSTPTISRPDGSCTGGSVSISGTDTAGKVVLDPGVGCAYGSGDRFIRVTFATPYSGEPAVVLTAASEYALEMPVSVAVDGAGASFDIMIGSVLPTEGAGISYTWYYHVIE